MIMVYSDVINNGLLLPKKDKYTKKDFDFLLKEGKKPKDARFICICSAIYYNTTYSEFFDKTKTRIFCGL